MKTITVPLPSLIVAFVAGTLLYIVGCKEPVDPYPNYSAPTGDEVLLVQQSKIRQRISIERTAGDMPNVLAEVLLEEEIKRTRPYPETFEYDEQGIARETYATYRRVGNQLIIANEDTLLLNQQGFVRRANTKRSYLGPGGYQYKYDAAGYLTEELIPDLYVSTRETSYQVNCRHEYASGNRIRSVMYTWDVYAQKAIDSLMISFEYNTKLVNSGLDYEEFGVICTTTSCEMADRLEKYHSSLYGKLNKNLPSRATVHYLKQWAIPSSTTALYKFDYVFNAKKEVVSMLITNRFQNVVQGLRETYEYVD